MNETNDRTDVLSALKNSSKGRLNYDRRWKEERRTQEIMNDVKLKTSSLTVSPKSVIDNSTKTTKDKGFTKYKVIETLYFDKSAIDSKDTENEINAKSPKDKSVRISRSNSFVNRSSDSTNDFELIMFEKKRHENVAQKFDKRRESLESVFKKFEEESDAEWKLIRQKYFLKAVRHINVYEDEFKAMEKSIEQSDKMTNFETNTHSKLKEVEAKHLKMVEEKQKRQLELRQKQLLADRTEIDSIFKTCLQISAAAEVNHKNDNIFHIIKQELNSMNGLLQNIDILLNKPDLNDYDIRNAQNLKLEVNRLRDKIVTDIESLKQISNQKTDSKPIVSDIIKMKESVVKTQESITQSVDIIREYLKLQKISNDFEESFNKFSTDNAFKQKKNALQLFVKTTINTISCESVDHIRDKLNRLTQLFSERPVDYGGKQIKCNQSDGSLPFCISLASKMFISVCTKQKDIELAMGPIIAVLWSRFPTFGHIFLAQLQEKCPYSLPLYPEKDSDDNDINYLIACGYTVSKDGTQESEESFLNRMRAMIRLYSSVIQCNIESGHPHGLKSGWNWLSRLLNSDPRPAITAAVLESFLSISCHKLYRFYGKQFVKIIEFIQKDYIKRIESVSLKDTKRQSLVKLQMFVDNVFNKMKLNISPKELIPEGLIPDYFFQSSYSHSRGFSFNNNY